MLYCVIQYKVTVDYVDNYVDNFLIMHKMWISYVDNFC